MVTAFIGQSGPVGVFLFYPGGHRTGVLFRLFTVFRLFSLFTCLPQNIYFDAVIFYPALIRFYFYFVVHEAGVFIFPTGALLQDGGLGVVGVLFEDGGAGAVIGADNDGGVSVAILLTDEGDAGLNWDEGGGGGYGGGADVGLSRADEGAAAQIAGGGQGAQQLLYLDL